MVQREVAERIAAPPGGMSYLSASSSSTTPRSGSRSRSRRRRSSRSPPSDRRVIVVEPYPADDRLADAEAEDALWRLVQAGFRERRKMLHNVLARQLPVEPARVAAALAAAGHRPGSPAPDRSRSGSGSRCSRRSARSAGTGRGATRADDASTDPAPRRRRRSSGSRRRS